MLFEQHGHKLNLNLTRADAYKMIGQLTQALAEQEKFANRTTVVGPSEACPYSAEGRDFPGVFTVFIEKDDAAT